VGARLARWPAGESYVYLRHGHNTWQRQSQQALDALAVCWPFCFPSSDALRNVTCIDMPPSLNHEGVIALVRDRPAFAASLLRELLNVEVPHFTEARLTKQRSISWYRSSTTPTPSCCSST